MKTHLPGVALLTSFVAVLPLAALAQDGFPENDEGPFVNGVFARPAYNLPVEDRAASEEVAPAVIFDDKGNSNELVVIFNYDHPTWKRKAAALRADRPEARHPRARLEAALIEAVRGRESESFKALHGAEFARYLTAGTRLSAESRATQSTGHPRERLEQYVILSYPSVEAALSAAEGLKSDPVVREVSVNRRAYLSWTPNDRYFAKPANATSAGRYQWGMHAMNFPPAWDISKGNSYVAVVDQVKLVEPGTSQNVDLDPNYRLQFSRSYPRSGQYHPFHGIHVAGIVAAQANNSLGVAGGCPNCSVALFASVNTLVDFQEGLTAAVDRGMQVVNFSFNSAPDSCANARFFCDALDHAADKDVVVIVAAGNQMRSGPIFPADYPSVLAVAGAQNTNPSVPGTWARWITTTPDTLYKDFLIGSAPAGIAGVTAPAKSIVSTVPQGTTAWLTYNSDTEFKCSDENTTLDESGVAQDGFGSCTGTSMAAPHVTGLAGLVRSINPRLTRTQVMSAIRSSGSNAGAPNATIGYGMPNALTAVNLALQQTTPTRLTPLFGFYSAGRKDRFYTTVPHMGYAALEGKLEPRRSGTTDAYVSEGLGRITGYLWFPMENRTLFAGDPRNPKADVWIFTTAANPKNAAIPLVPLYRLSWKCGDPTPSQPAVCGTTPNHIDTTYTADTAGVAAYQGEGYKLDGIEGYIYPKTMSPQPPGTVRLMRKYNPTLDDHAIFPESKLSTMTNLGYTQNSGSDWLGYVYPNFGVVPTIQ